jgi:hypothetical protein
MQTIRLHVRLDEAIVRLRKLSGPQHLPGAVHTEQILEARLRRCLRIQQDNAPVPVGGWKGRVTFLPSYSLQWVDPSESRKTANNRG